MTQLCLVVASLGSPCQVGVRQGRTRPGSARHGSPRLGRDSASLSSPRHGKSRLGRAGHSSAVLGAAPLFRSGRGQARQVPVWLVPACPGTAFLGVARLTYESAAIRVMARSGRAWRGATWLDKASLSNMPHAARRAPARLGAAGLDASGQRRASL